jgi:peptidoglycan hydrolase-like protein with peptidoglycan-binding domain
MSRAAWLGCALLSIVLPAAAGDGTGRFAVKGVGTATCESYVEALKQGGQRAYMFGGWVYGFLTAENRHRQQTFDISAWEDLETLTGYLSHYCEQHPREAFAQGVISMVEAMQDGRLRESSPPVQIDVAGTRIVLYQEALRRAQQALNDAGHDAGAADGRYTESTHKALQAFQAAQGLPATGLPDQATLHRLLRARQGDAPAR